MRELRSGRGGGALGVDAVRIMGRGYGVSGDRYRGYLLWRWARSRFLRFIAWFSTELF